MFVPRAKYKLQSKFSVDFFCLLCSDTIINEIANNDTLFLSDQLQNSFTCKSVIQLKKAYYLALLTLLFIINLLLPTLIR